MKILRYLFITALLVYFVLPKKTYAQDTGWVIDQFESNIQVFTDSRVEVEESISVDFKQLEKHGIFRNIPVNYRDRLGNNLNIRLKVLSVTDEIGRTRQHKTKKKGKEIEIKIGNPKVVISGKQIYVIKYQINRVITRFDDHDELYWNVTGSNWPVPILNSLARVTFPDRVVNATCFSGRSGSNFQDCTFESSGKTAVFQSFKVLTPGEGLTIVAAVKNDIVEPVSMVQRTIWFVSDNWVYTLPFFILLILLRLYWQHGRDEQYKSLFDPSLGSEKLPLFTSELVPSTYAPLKDIKPAEAGTLMDEKVNIRDIAATIVDLAVRGILEIEEIKKGKIIKSTDYRIIWKNKDTSTLEEYENQLLTGLFGKDKSKDTILLSKLKYKFHTHLKKIKDKLYERMSNKGYFPRRPDKVVSYYIIVGIVIASLGFIFFSMSLTWAVAFIASGGFIVLFSKAMPKRTAFGRKHFLRVLGFKNFISLGAYRQQLWERANIFEEVMPYAIALNLTHKWAEAFESVKISEPKWFKGTTSFNPTLFSHSMENFTRATTTTLPATKSASGGSSGFSGGFSGGGFGGGGGGSW
jgi:hypothetical protein